MVVEFVNSFFYSSKSFSVNAMDGQFCLHIIQSCRFLEKNRSALRNFTLV